MKFFTKDRLFNILLIIPFLNAIATSATSYFEPGTINPGTIRAGLVTLFIIYIFLFTPVLKQNKFFVLYLFLFHLFIMAVISSKISISLYIYLRIFISTTLFPISYYYFNRYPDLRRFNKIFLVVLLLFGLNFLFANYFSHGASIYLAEEDTVYFGGVGVNMTKIIAVLLLMVPGIYITLSSKNAKIITIGLLIFSIIITLIGLKRTALLSLGAGIITQYWKLENKTRYTKYIFAAVTIMLLLSPYYITKLEIVIQERQDRLNLQYTDNLENEARYNEIFMVVNDLAKRDLLGILFGTELFNEMNYYKTKRMLHTDYMTLLHGSGIVGLSLYIGIFLVIYKSLKKTYKRMDVSDKRLFTYYYSIAISLIVASLFLGIAGSIQAVEPRSLVMMYLGGILGIMNSKLKQNFIPRLS